MKKRIVSATVAAAMMLTLFTGCGGDTTQNSGTSQTGNSGAPKVDTSNATVIRLATTSPTSAYDDVSSGTAAVDRYFIENLPERTNGRYVIEYFPDGQLASSTTDIINGVKSGAFQMSTLSVANWGEYTDAFAETNVPFLFDSFETAASVLNSGLAEQMMSQAEKDVGVKCLLMPTIGFRQITTKNTPIHVASDLKGIKLRVQSDPIQIASFEELGVSVTNVSYNELFSAMQQGLCDGQENPPTNIFNKKFYEVQKYLTRTNHSYSVSCFFINQEFWDSLPEEDQQIFMEIAKEAEEYSRERVIELDDYFYEQLEANGMEIIDPTEEELKTFSDAMVEKVWPMCIEVMGQERWDNLMRLVDEATGA